MCIAQQTRAMPTIHSSCTSLIGCTVIMYADLLAVLTTAVRCCVCALLSKQSHANHHSSRASLINGCTVIM
jgi:hypothetical protein